MTVLSWVWLWVFVGCSVGFFFVRKMKSRLPLIGLMLGTVISLILLIQSNEKRLYQQEVVWHPKAVQWAKVPVPIFWNRTDYNAYNSSIEQSLSTWNDRIGCKFFIGVGSEQEALVRIHPFDGTVCGHDTTAVQIEESPTAPARI